MKHLLKTIALLSLVVCAMVSCSDDEQPLKVNDTTIEVSTDSVIFSSDADSKLLTITTNGKWYIENISDWITISSMNGEGAATLTISVSENTTNKDRGAYILIKTSSNSEVIVVTQGIIAEGEDNENEEQSLPTVSTSSVSSISYTSAVIGGNVSNENGFTVIDRGVCLSTSPNPTTSNRTIVVGSGLGEYSTTITGLTENTTYYVRAYATNSKGTSYGDEVTLSTLEVMLPTISTLSVANISYTSAVMGGNVSNENGSTVTERGVCWSTSSNPTILNSKQAVGSGLGEYSTTMSGLLDNTTYYVRAYATNTKGTSYGKEMSFTTKKLETNGHEYVDLGLSVMWATYNIGATKPEEYGNYYAWGEVATKSTYDWSTYKYGSGSLKQKPTKYCTTISYDTFDNKTKLEQSDDVAYTTLGGNWRMPTDAEWTELRENCIWEWTAVNGVNGYKVSAANGNSIFLPASGYRDSEFHSVGSYGYYWSSSLVSDEPYYAWGVRFYFVNSFRSSYARYYGQSVRPVLGL